MKQDELKRMAAEAAAREVNSGEIVGLGTGSTTYYAIKYLGERTKDEGLGIIGIPTSRATEKIARESGIPLGTFEEYQEIDIAIDGADQVDHRLNLIKGGGGAHVREKIVASTAKRFLVVVDETKVSKELNIPVPVEVLPYATGLVIKRLEAMGATSLLRLSKKDYFISDNGNYVLDADFGTIEEPKKLEQDINRIKGVVDNGIFAGYRPEVYVGTKSGVEVFHF